MYDRWVLTALLAWPLVAGALVLLVPAARAKQIALLASLIEFALSVPLWWLFVPAAGMQFGADYAWIPAWGIRYTVGVDGISLFLVLLTTFLVPLSVLGSWSYVTRRERGFYALLLVLTTGMIGVFVALDLFLFYVMWEVMLIPMYFIIGVWGGDNRLYAAIKFFIYTMLGSLLMLVAILVLYVHAGRVSGIYSFAYLHLLTHAVGLGSLAWWLFGAFFLAFAIKVPLFPFHTWLPDAHVEAPTAGSVLLAGILLKMGTYGFLRFAMPLFPAVALHETVQFVIVALSLIGIIYGGLVAMVQPDFKKLIAYSSVAHLGFVMLGIWALTLQSVQGALLVMINHGISTGALFFLVGMIYERRHSRLIEAYGGIARVVPVFAAILTVVSLSSIGLPGTNGFVGEFLVLLGAFRTYPLAAALATVGVIIAAAYLLWALQRILFNPLSNPENERLGDLTPRELAVLLPLLACIVWIGVYP
ncbi:MAG: complex I subunit 4 family protein, partial [Gemmatimonadales bacterium]